MDKTKKVKELTPKQLEALAKKEEAFKKKQELADAWDFVNNIDKDYHALPYFSASKIKSYEENPSLYEYRKHTPYESPTLVLGTIVHKLILENKDFETNRKKYELVLQPKQLETLHAIEKNYKNNLDLLSLVKKAKYIEKEIIFDLKLNVYLDKPSQYVKCKSKIDMFSCGALIDVKTCQNLEKFRKDIDIFRYDMQLSFYTEALKSLKEEKKSVMILAVEKNPPYDMQLFRLSDNYIYRGKFGGSIWSKTVRGWRQPLDELVNNNLKKRYKEAIEDLEVYE